MSEDLDLIEDYYRRRQSEPGLRMTEAESAAWFRLPPTFRQTFTRRTWGHLRPWET